MKHSNSALRRIKCKEVAEWKKEAIVFVIAHNHTMSKVAGFVGVSKKSFERVYKEWCTTCCHENTRSELWSEKFQ